VRKKVNSKRAKSMQSSKASNVRRVKSRKGENKGKAANRKKRGKNKSQRKELRPIRAGKRSVSHKLVVKKQDIVIRRSSGRKEKFDTERLAQTVGRSGVPFLMARDIAKKATRKIKSQVRSKQGKKKLQAPKSKLAASSKSKPIVVKAGQVRNIVSEELRDRNRPDIASSYSGNPPEHVDLETKPSLNDREPVLDIVAANKTKVLYDPCKQKGSA
jgi:hypothetical protein